MSFQLEDQFGELAGGKEEEIQEGLNLLDEKLATENWAEKAKAAIRGAIDASTGESLERDLIENLHTHLERKIVPTINFVLANNAPNVYQKQGFEVSDKCANFFEEITSQYGMKVKRSIQKYYTPNDWRYIDTVLQLENKEGSHLKSTILKENGETVVLTTSVPDAFIFVNHFLDNLHMTFDPNEYGEEKMNEIYDRMTTIQKTVNQLKAEWRNLMDKDSPEED